jgi:hypothetical protein
MRLASTSSKPRWVLPADDPTDSLKWYSEEMEDCTSGYAEYVLEQVEAAKETCADPVVLIEQRVDFSRWVEQGFGTADCIIIADGTLRVIDYKHGLGVLVSAEGNPQMQCYASALWSFSMTFTTSTGFHDHLPAKTPERQHLRDQQGRPVPLGG